MKRRLIAMLLAFVMLVGMLPIQAFATEEEQTQCATEGCTYVANHEGNCSNYVAPTEPCGTEGCTYGLNHEGNCSNYVAPTEPCGTEGCTYGLNHEGNCSNYVAPTESCGTEGCTYGLNHEGNCSNYVAPTDCETEGCTYAYGHEGDCSPVVDQTAAQNVIDQINAIGEVTLESEAAISAADAAYNALTDAQKELVTNLDVLETAKNSYSALSTAMTVEAVNEPEVTTAKISVTIQGGSQFLIPPQLDVEVTSNLAESYGYADQVTDGVSTIDVLVRAHELGYGSDFTKETASSYLIVNNNFITKLCGVENSNVCILVNGAMPNNGTGTSYGVEQAKVVDGNLVEFARYQDETAWTDNYVWLELADGTKVDGQTVPAGYKAEVVAKGYSPFTYGHTSQETINANTTTISGAKLALVNVTDGILTDLGITTDDEGRATVTVPRNLANSTCYLVAYGDYMFMTLAEISVGEALVTDACNLTALEIGIGTSSGTEPTQTLTFTTDFAEDTTSYSVPVVDYIGSWTNRVAYIKATAANKDAVITASIDGTSTAVTSASESWAKLVKAYATGYVYGSPLQASAKNVLDVTITVGEESKTYTVIIPIQSDLANRSLAWTTDLADDIYYLQNTEASLSVAAQYKNRPLDNEDVITYQWYSNTTDSTEGGTAIEGATAAVYAPSTAALGTTYYYVVASCAELTPITSNVMAVTVTDEAAPTSVSLVCDYPYTIENTWASALGGVTYVATIGDKLNIKAVDQNGKETPVSWKVNAYGGTFDTVTGEYTITSTGYTYLTATSLYDPSITSGEKAIQISDYKISSYNRDKSVALSTDGQTAKTGSVSGGIAGHTTWTYEIPEGVAECTTDLTKKDTSIGFNLLRPGVINVSYTLDLGGEKDPVLTDSTTLTVTGVAVEDAEGKQTKTYLEMTAEQPNPTVQLTAYVAEGRTVASWTSADENIATVDENGLVTAKAVGSVIITATDSEGTKGGIKVVISDADVPTFENIAFTTGRNGIKTKITYEPLTFDYTGLEIYLYSTSSLTLTNATLYNTEKLSAVATYTDIEGTEQSITVNSGAATTLPNIPFGTSIITIKLADKTDTEKFTTYTFEVTRPRDTSKQIAYSAGIVMKDADGNNLSADLYNEKAEGYLFRTDDEGVLSGNSYTVTYSYYNYRTFLLDGRESFTMQIKGYTNYVHIRYSTDDGATWTELPQGGGNTGVITFPGIGADGSNPVVKVILQVVSDSVYMENGGAFPETVTHNANGCVYTVWAEQIPPASEAKIRSASVSIGDWYPAFDTETTGYNLSVPAGGAAPVLTYTVSEGATVTIDDVAQTPNEDGSYTLTLTNTSQIVSVTGADKVSNRKYSFRYSERAAGGPDKVVDFLSVNSQYTNGGQYGMYPESTLAGNTALLSLGNFGGYVTYYFENGLTDNPNNQYGVDFYVNGNAFVDTSTGTGLGSMEPGQVWVSEDGSNWYALAGSEHYNADTLWNYSVTYSKNGTGTNWTDNYGNSNYTVGRSFSWPLAENYPLNSLVKQDSFTLSGVLIPSVNGITGVDSFNTFSSGAKFGYVDVLVNGTANPYLANDDYKNESTGFDLAWAVDESGNPVDVSGKSFHYVKIVTASNILAGAANEKSTEVSNVVRATAQAKAVGTTGAPTGVTFTDGAGAYVLTFEEGKQVYEVELNMENVSILVDGTAEYDNIYINNQRVASGTAAEGFTVTEGSETLVRIIVQNGDKEPVIYLLKLAYKDTSADPVDVTVTVSNKGTLALVNGTVTVKDTNTDGILTYHEALEAAHAAYCPNGYTAAETDYGISISKIWGVETYNSLYFRNGEVLANHVGNTETSTVAEGDSLLVSVNKDDKYYSDRYSSFNVSAKTAVVGETFTLTLKADLSTGSAVVPNATVGTWSDGVFTPLEGMTTDASGKVKLSFAEVGTYIVSASGTVSDTVQDWSNGGAEVTADCPIIAPVCVVKVVDVPYFSDLDLYKNSSEYTNGAEPLEITPAFVGTVYDGYSVQVPDYLSSVYAVGTLSEQTLNSGWNGRVMYSNNWGGWTGVSLVNGVTKGSSVFSKGYVSIYLDSRDNGEYKIDVTQYATLKGLTIDGVVDKDFGRDITIYHAYVDGTAESVVITPTAYKTDYTIKINGTEVTDGEGYTLPYSWDASGKMAVTIEVSGTNVTASTYTVELEQMPRNDAPFIMKESTEADYTIIDTKVADLFVEASANGELTYQWYYNTTDSNKNGTIIEGATASSYTPPITEDVIGTRYYYCVITNNGKTEGNVTTSTATRITVDPDPTPVVTFNNPGEAMPEDGYEYPWNIGYVYKVGAEAIPLTITATSAAEGGEWSYKWWNKSSAYTSSYSTATGETSGISYIPNTSLSQANDTGRYYACQVSYTFKGKTYTSWAKTGETYTDDKGKTYDVVAAYVFLKVDEAAVPEITTQPKSASYIVGDSMTALSAGANRADGGKLTYQWYENTTNSTEGGTAIEGATRNSYSLGTASEGGTKYYYCVVTNTIQGYTATTTSKVAEITVKTVADVLDGRLNGSGTQEDPYLIENAQDYQDVYDLVAEGMSFEDMYLKQVNDITLPEGWKSIGVLIDPSVGHINSGRNMNAFSGTLDGNGKTVTVPEGCEPLLGYVKGATVKNLNIYGKQIAGYGLVNHLEGVGLSGEAICIDNVTLKSGSSTLKSGLIGTYITNNGYAGCSAAFYVTIKNCTIEKDVVVGYNKDQSMIGSIAGRVHGTIENCVSYATVYGKDYVGGILGTRDNAMGTCAVTNCTFGGTVEATGQHVGGIVGGGYQNSSAPNGGKVNINDCSASGSVTGADKVGGIVGGDTYVAQLWGAHSLKNNAFTGTVKATSGTYVGGIIGYYLSLNKYDDIADNYYKAGCGADRGIGFVQYVDTSCETHETEIGATYFNTGDGTDECPTVAGCSWKKAHNRTDDPLGADAAKLCHTDSTPVTATQLQVSGTYKTEYTKGESLDLTGIVLTVSYTDGSTKTITLEDVTVTGYDAQKVGTQELTITYDKLTAKITVMVKNPVGEISVTVSVLGDSAHGNNGSVHTLAGGGLTTWVSAKTYTVDSNATVWDVLQRAFAENGIHCSYTMSRGTVYIQSLSYGGVTLSEFTNGANSGWMYTLNGAHPLNGVAQQYLSNGDSIVFHYTDDYTKEEGSSGYEDKNTVDAVIKLINAIGKVTLDRENAIENARAAYNKLSDAEKKQVTNYNVLTAAEATLSDLQIKNAETLIHNIGTVTLNSIDKINAAWNAYNALTTAQKLKVSNRGVLGEAQEKYDNLRAEEVEKLIDAIDQEITLESEEDIVAARKAYDALNKTQQALVDQEHLDKLKAAELALAELKATEKDKEKAQEVIDMIDKLGEITLDSEEDIEAVRKAYDKLTDIQKSLVTNYDDLVAAEEALEDLKDYAAFEDVYTTTGDYIEGLGTPQVGSIGGEWMVIGLARSGREVPGVEDYYNSVVAHVLENADENERLHSAKSTDNSRIILALTAIGKDVTDVSGHNLLNGLNDMDYIQYQGINGPIWALMALDSGNYPVPEGNVTREKLIEVILEAQLADGGWAISGDEADSDMTGMALQALAPYYNSNDAVKQAVEDGIVVLSLLQNEDGSFGTYDGNGGKVATSESIAQVIVALTTLGINPDKDERFIKNGSSALDALIDYYVMGGGFKHLLTGNRDGMATEQGYYALVAYYRFLMNNTSLYNMTDILDMGGDVEAEPTETAEAAEPVEAEDNGSGIGLWIVIMILCAGSIGAVILNRKKIFGKFL